MGLSHDGGHLPRPIILNPCHHLEAYFHFLDGQTFNRVTWKRIALRAMETAERGTQLLSREGEIIYFPGHYLRHLRKLFTIHNHKSCRLRSMFALAKSMLEILVNH